MSKIIASAAISLLAIGLPIIGVNVGSEQLTVTVQTIIVVVAQLWIWVSRVNMGGVNLAGIRD